MNIDHDGDEDMKELNHVLEQGNKRGMDGVVSEEKNLEEDNGLKVNGIAENLKDGHGGALQAPASLQTSHHQQQSQATMVCWEKFLHLRSLKVLLVENDDSTRHVVTALLRNCSYEVIEAANGLQGWKILEDLSNHVDLVLTEVVMPSLSGIALLWKITSHKTRRNVPVIMMSSHDSMGLVFKCLSNGAVDFLVKPIRKNELKNLWQHVWRRCHSVLFNLELQLLIVIYGLHYANKNAGSLSEIDALRTYNDYGTYISDTIRIMSSGSGSESGTQTKKSIKSNSTEKSDNNTGSNDKDDNGSIGLNGDGSDNGSGTQSSWTKQALEVDSPWPMSPWNHIAEHPDSTCAQVIHSNAELSSSKQVPLTVKKEHHEQEGKPESGGIAKDWGMAVPRELDMQLEYPDEDLFKVVRSKQNNLPERGPSRINEQIDKGELDLNSESPSSKAILDHTEFEGPSRHSKILDTQSKAIGDAKEILSLELSLKRVRGVKDPGTSVQDERNVLRRSDSSAFSRYSASNANQASGEIIKSGGSTRETSLDAAKKGLGYDLQSQSNCNDPNQSSKMGSNNIDVGSTTNNNFNQSVVLKNKPGITSTVKCLQPLSIFQPVNDDVEGAASLAQSIGIHCEAQIHHLACHHVHHCHLVHNKQQQQLPCDLDDSSSRKIAAPAPHCGSSNVLGGPVEVNAGNYSINGSASGSNHGSNGQIGSSMAVNAGGTNVESDNGMGGNCGNGDGSGSRGENRIDQDKMAQRQAALTKFQQKRKERCFRKKVRYQSRKRLAEQRPRVRGQFVRQTANENMKVVTLERCCPSAVNWPFLSCGHLVKTLDSLNLHGASTEEEMAPRAHIPDTSRTTSSMVSKVDGYMKYPSIDFD